MVTFYVNRGVTHPAREMRKVIKEFLQELVRVDRSVAAVVDEGPVRKAHTHGLKQNLSSRKRTEQGRNTYVIQS
jgi:hypothetical protein